MSAFAGMTVELRSETSHASAARRNPRHRARQFHRRPTLRHPARRHGRRRHQGRAAAGRHGARHPADPERRERELHGAQPQQAQPRARPEAARGARDHPQARGKVRRAGRGLPARRAGEDGARLGRHQSGQPEDRLHVGLGLWPDRTGPPPSRREPDHRGILRRALGHRRTRQDADAAGRADRRRVRGAVRGLCDALRSRRRRTSRRRPHRRRLAGGGFNRGRRLGGRGVSRNR